jgi:hypothetical protein
MEVIKKKSIDIDEATLSEIKTKYPTLNFELAMPNEVFDESWQKTHCVSMPIEPVQDYFAKTGQYTDVSLVADLDLNHLENFKVGTKVSLGKFTMTVKCCPTTFQPIADISINYKI